MARKPTPRKPPKRKKAASSSKGGRPTLYQPTYCDIARQLCEQGATDQEIADVLRIDRATLYRWFAEHPEFRDAVKLGKAPADDRVERSLFHRAVGYEYDSVKIMQDKGRPLIVPFREHVPPDAGAAFNWLKNRRPDQWRDKLDIDARLRPLDMTAEPLPADDWDRTYSDTNRPS